MKTMSLWKQVLILSLLSLVLGVINNLRPDIAIEWVRDWPAYSSVLQPEKPADQKKPEPAEAQQAEPAQGETEPPAQASQADRAEATMSMLFGNAQVTDIGLDQALNLYTFAKDETLWIDARDPELFAEGHIQNAVLCYLYEKNTYLPELEATIAERNPTALVVYCKGADCTDSHVLAEDLFAMGNSNIFVYTGGFNEWYQAGHPIAGNLADAEAEPESAVAEQVAAEEPVFDAEAAEAAMAALFANAGQVTDVELEMAHDLFRYAKDETLWIDARDAALYAEGHIKGAVLCHLYEKNTYLPELEATIAERGPTALVVYCKGADCTDSHVLAQDLFAMGHSNIFVYIGGFNEWYQEGYPIEGALAAEEAAATQTVGAEVKPRERTLEIKPPGMYLEHVLRDMIPFVLGMFLVIGWRYFSTRNLWIILASIFVGGFFIWAAWSKIENPFLFAKNIWNYDVVPGQLINISALWLPMLELLAGLCLIFGVFRRGSSTIMSGLLLIFIIAVSYNVLRGHEFDCGCTSTGTLFTDIYLEGWNSKYLLLLRDFGLLAMSVMGFSLAKKEAKSGLFSL